MKGWLVWTGYSQLTGNGYVGLMQICILDGYVVNTSKCLKFRFCQYFWVWILKSAYSDPSALESFLGLSAAAAGDVSK